MNKLLVFIFITIVALGMIGSTTIIGILDSYATKTPQKKSQQPSEAPADSKSVDQAINNITAALQELVDSIKGKASPLEIMTIVHTRVLPNFITAFGLQIS